MTGPGAARMRAHAAPPARPARPAVPAMPDGFVVDTATDFDPSLDVDHDSEDVEEALTRLDAVARRHRRRH